MALPELPHPVTNEETFLAAILKEIRGLREDLNAPQTPNPELLEEVPAPPTSSTVEKVKEPAKAEKPKSRSWRNR